MTAADSDGRPLLRTADWAFGTWFTWWSTYTEEQAKGEVMRWKTDKLPIDGECSSFLCVFFARSLKKLSRSLGAGHELAEL